jgi:hypothetical protein
MVTNRKSYKVFLLPFFMKKGKIITLGGPSGVGKSSVLEELSKIYEFKEEKKYDAIMFEAEKRGFTWGYQIEEHFDELEKIAHENMIDRNMPKILEIYYAVNEADLKYALCGVPTEKELNSPYRQSTGIETIKLLAEKSNLYTICLIADSGEIIGRANKRAEGKGVVKTERARPPRSTNFFHVENEKRNVINKFLEFYELARESNPNVVPIYINTKNKNSKEIAEIIKREIIRF